jgi:copper(I)-binding protein
MAIRTTLARALCLGAMALVAAPYATAQPVRVGGLAITDAWSRATPPGATTAAGYLTITNGGGEADRLVAVTTPAAAAGELHRMAMAGPVMTMEPVKGGIEIAAGATVTLAPGGLHIMFTGLHGGLREGEAMPVTLTFEKAGDIAADLRVLSIGAMGPAHPAMTHGPVAAPVGAP